MAKILAVDDEPLLLELMGELLGINGHTVVGLEDALGCLDALRGGGFQMAILDISMPQLSGMDLLRLIRLDPKLKNLPVLMCTGRGMMGDVDQAFAAGATGYIVKPFSAAALNGSVTKGLAATS